MTAPTEQLHSVDLATMIFKPTCPKCGASTGQWRGYRATRKGIFHRRWCSKCGKWCSINIYQGPVARNLPSGDNVRDEKLRFDAWMEAYEESLSRGDAL